MATNTSTGTNDDKKNLWQALKELIEAFRKLIENKGKIPVLEREISNLQQTVDDMSWVSVANYDQLEALTEKITDISRKITVAEKNEDYLKQNVENIKKDIQATNNAFATLNEYAKEFEELFEGLMKKQDKMKYDIAMVGGLVIVYSTEFGFEKANENKDDVCVVVMNEQGLISEYDSIAEMNKGMDINITKEMLAMGTCNAFLDIDLAGLKTCEEKGQYLFRSMKDNLLKNQREEIEKLQAMENVNQEALDNAILDKTIIEQDKNKLNTKILKNQFDTWYSENKAKISNFQVKGEVCKITLVSGDKLTFTLGKETLIDTVTLLPKGSDANSIPITLYSVDNDFRETINEGYLMSNPFVEKVLHSTPFWNEQVDNDRINHLRVCEVMDKELSKISEVKVVTMTPIEMAVSGEIMNSLQDIDLSVQMNNYGVVYTNEEGGHLALRFNKETESVTFIGIDDKEDLVETVSVPLKDLENYATRSDFKGFKGFENIVPKISETIKQSEAIVERRIAEKDKAELDKDKDNDKDNEKVDVNLD